MSRPRVTISRSGLDHAWVVEVHMGPEGDEQTRPEPLRVYVGDEYAYGNPHAPATLPGMAEHYLREPRA